MTLEPPSVNDMRPLSRCISRSHCPGSIVARGSLLSHKIERSHESRCVISSGRMGGIVKAMVVIDCGSR